MCKVCIVNNLQSISPDEHAVEGIFSWINSYVYCSDDSSLVLHSPMVLHTHTFILSPHNMMLLAILLVHYEISVTSAKLIWINF